MPGKENCPICGWTMFKLSGRGRKRPFCINPDCSNFLPEDKRGGFKKKTQDAAEGESAEKKPTAGKGGAKKTAAKKTAAAPKTTTVKKAAASKKTTTKKAAAAKKTKKTAAE